MQKGLQVITHDDRLVLRGQKHEVGLKKGRSGYGWRKNLIRDDKILGYWNPETKEKRSVEEGARLGFLEVHPYKTNLSKKVTLSAQDSYVDIRIGGLYQRDKVETTRYLEQLNSVLATLQKEILDYKPRSLEPTDKNKRDALRNRLNKHWKVSSYEYNVTILDRQIGAVLFSELEGFAEHREENTVYVKGFKGTSSSNKPILLKYYDMQDIHQVDAFKIEITFRKDYLKRHKLKEPKKWLTADKMQDILKAGIIKNLNKVFKQAPKAKKMLSQKMGVTQANLLNEIVSPEYTLIEVGRRVDRLEKKQAITEANQRKLQAQVKAIQTQR